MTDIASLDLKIDSTAVKTGVSELDKLTAAGGRVEKATKGFQGEWVKASSEAGKLRMGLIGAEAQMNRVTASAGAQKAGMQQLSYQLNDVATMYASGAGAAQIFGTQLGQTLQAVQLMAGGTSKFAAFLGGPWGVALSTAAIVLSPFIARLFDTVTAADTARTALQSLIDKQRELQAERIKEASAEGGLNALRDKRLKIENQITRLRGEGKDTSVREQDLRQTRLQIIEAEGAINASSSRTQATTVTLTKAVIGHGAATRAATVAIREQKPVLDAQAEAYASLAKDAQSAAAQIEKALSASLNTNLTQMQDEISRGSSEWMQAANDNAKATAYWNDELRDTIRLLDGLGGFGSVLGNIGAIFEAIGSGNWQNVNGPLGIIGKSLGGVLNNTYTTGMDDNGRWIKSFGEILSEKLDAVFGGQGSFAKTLQSAGVGMAAGQMINGSKNSGLGSAVGGVIGKVAGQAIGKSVGGALGSAMGPIGSIVGGVLGGLVGGLFSKAKTGSASVSNGAIQLGGNNGDARGAANTTAGGIGSSINKIIEALGGSAGAYGFTIGTRKDEFRVSGSAGANVTSKNPGGLLYKGKDGAEAARIALLNAIQDGAVAGISEGAQRLLRAGSDIDAQLTKALQFNDVFDRLKQKVDPLGYALGQIDKGFAKLKTVFDEAGATASDYAQLEQLIALQRQEAIDDDAAKQLDKLNERRNLEVRLMEAQGNAAGALALQRTIERSETESSLRGLMDQIYAAEDLATAQQDAASAAEAAQAKFRSFANDLRKFRDELTSGDGVASYRGSRASLMATGAMAAAGNADALSNLRGAAESFLESAKDQASSSAQYQRDVALVRGYLNTAIAVADGGTVTGIAGASGTPEQIAAANGQVNASLLNEMQAMRAEVSAQRAETRAANETLVIANNTMMRLHQRWDRGGSLAIVTDDDRPIKTVAA